MDKLTQYSNIIKKILTEYVELCQHHPKRDRETLTIFDDLNHHYIWMNLGWEKGERLVGMTAYIRIREEKCWIEEDWTEEGIATDLVRAGIPKDDIVLAFHEPKIRQYTDFSVA